MSLGHSTRESQSPADGMLAISDHYQLHGGRQIACRPWSYRCWCGGARRPSKRFPGRPASPPWPSRTQWTEQTPQAYVVAVPPEAEPKAGPQFSSDGYWWWDGTRWMSTLSADGQYRWTGAVWEATRGAGSRQEWVSLNARLEFEFRVGESEVHVVRFSFSQLSGVVKIWVDNKVVKRDLRLLSFSRFKEYRLMVGDVERHEVLIRKERPWVAAGLRQQVCHVVIDGMPAGDYASRPLPPW